MRLPPYRILATLALLLAGLCLRPSSLSGQTIQIDSMTANLIEGIADFTRWPDSYQREQITIGVINAREVSNYLERRANQRTNSPALEVRNLTLHDSFEDIHIVFVGPGLRDQWQEISQKCHGKGILCIGAQEGFNQRGGTVELVVRKNRLRFYINTENARKSDIELSSKILELALEPKR